MSALHPVPAVLRAREISDTGKGHMPQVQQTKETAMTTHMKVFGRSGPFTLCGKHGATTTNLDSEVDCKFCKTLMFGSPRGGNPPPVAEENRKNTHYDAGGIETIDVIRAKLTPEQFSGYCLGTALAYLLRANFKGQYASDVDKAADYTKWLSEHTKKTDNA